MTSKLLAIGARGGKRGWAALNTREARRALLLCCTLQMLQQARFEFSSFEVTHPVVVVLCCTLQMLQQARFQLTRLQVASKLLRSYFLQVSGINAIVYFTPQLLRQAGTAHPLLLLCRHTRCHVAKGVGTT